MKMQSTMPLTVAGYGTGAFGLAANWMAVNWLMALSALSIVCAMYWGFARHRREERRMKQLEDKDES